MWGLGLRVEGSGLPSVGGTREPSEPYSLEGCLGVLRGMIIPPPAPPQQEPRNSSFGVGSWESEGE